MLTFLTVQIRKVSLAVQYLQWQQRKHSSGAYVVPCSALSHSFPQQFYSVIVLCVTHPVYFSSVARDILASVTLVSLQEQLGMHCSVPPWQSVHLLSCILMKVWTWLWHNKLLQRKAVCNNFTFVTANLTALSMQWIASVRKWNRIKGKRRGTISRFYLQLQKLLIYLMCYIVFSKC